MDQNHAAGATRTATSQTPVAFGGPPAWRCDHCHTKLGVIYDDQLEIKAARGTEYRCHLPASAKCRKCGTLNQIGGPSRAA